MGLGERMGDLDVDMLISWCYQPSGSKSLCAKTKEVSGHIQSIIFRPKSQKSSFCNPSTCWDSETCLTVVSSSPTPRPRSMELVNATLNISLQLRTVPCTLFLLCKSLPHGHCHQTASNNQARSGPEPN